MTSQRTKENLNSLDSKAHPVTAQSRPIGQDVKIEREVATLASLSKIEYERKRSPAAMRLNVRVSILDKWVQAERDRIKNEKAASEILGGNTPCHAENVAGQEIFIEGTTLIARFSVLPDFAIILLLLWVISTHAFSVAQVSPILALISPVMRCGKTTVLAVLEKLVFRAMTTANITAAALFHAVEMYRPTLLIDEGDTFLRQSEDLGGIINSGHTPTSAYVIRIENGVPRKFSTWCPKAFASIGALPATMQDRAIAIRMRRKRSSEVVESLRDANPAEFDALKSKIARWTKDNLQAISACRPILPDLSSDRAKDNWVPLLAIAECLGPECAQAARNAAISLEQGWDSPGSIAEEFLVDTAEAFERSEMTRMRTVTLIDYLCAEDEKPWATYNRGRPITPRQIAQIIRVFGIKSKRLRKGDEVAWGYELSQFEDAFARYVTKTDGTEA